MKEFMLAISYKSSRVFREWKSSFWVKRGSYTNCTKFFCARYKLIHMRSSFLLETGNRQQQTLGSSFMKQLSSFEVYNWTRWFFDFCFDCLFFSYPPPSQNRGSGGSLGFWNIQETGTCGWILTEESNWYPPPHWSPPPWQQWGVRCDPSSNT